MPDAGWNEWSKYVLEELKRLNVQAATNAREIQELKLLERALEQELAPIKRVVHGLIALILTTVFGAILALVITR